MKISDYDNATNKRAPRMKFVCPYCGQTVERRLSKVRNPNLVFCNNDCRAKYAEREALKSKLYVPDSVIDKEIQKYTPLILKLYKDIVDIKNDEVFDSFFQIARIEIWKAYNVAHNGKGSIISYYAKAIKHGYYKFKQREFHSCSDDVEIISITDFMDEYLLTDYQNSDENNIFWKNMKKDVINFLKKQKECSFNIFKDVVIDGLTHKQAAEKYDVNVGAIKASISYAKKELKRLVLFNCEL